MGGSELTSVSAWDEMIRAYREYLDTRERLFAGDPTPDLRGALISAIPTPVGRDTALQVLREVGVTRPDVVADLVPELVELGLGLDYRSAWVREILARLDNAVLGARMEPIVREFVSGRNARDASEYWGLIELLDKAELTALRDGVIAEALRSSDSDTRIMAERWADHLRSNGRKT